MILRFVTCALLLVPTLILADPAALSAPKPVEKQTIDPSRKSAPEVDLSIPFPLVDIFSVEQNPGQGFLEYVQGNAIERIDLGAATGTYAMGMVFGPAALPEPIALEFKNKEVIQIAFGTMKSKLAAQVPQFGSASLIAARVPRQKTVFPLAIPDGKSKGPPDSAMLLFTSPRAPLEQSDEEKLKNTFFAQKGTITLTPKSQLRKLEVKGPGQKLAFNMVLMEAEFDAVLFTPFNAQENVLRGTIQFPVYWPESRAGHLLAKKLAQESFAATSTIQIPEELTERAPSAKPPKPTKPRPRSSAKGS